MTASTSPWMLELLDHWSEPYRFEVTRDRIIAYADATNDEHPAHRSGDLAPPVFPVVGALIEAVAPAFMAVVPPEVADRVVHGEQDFLYHQPIRPGMTLLTRAAAVGVHGTSSGVVVIAKGMTETTGGEPVVEQHAAAFFRGARFDVHVGESLTDHAADPGLLDKEPLASATYAYDPDQTFRYSEASGDPIKIHLDDAFARSVGLPGIIVHGLCTLAFCSRVVVEHTCQEDPTRLRRLACRFSSIVQPHETLTTTVWQADASRFAFTASTDGGAKAVKDGLAEVS